MIEIDEIGNKYGKLTVKEKSKSTRYGISWVCVCECGREVTRLGVYLRNHVNINEASCRFCKDNGPERRMQNKVLHKQYKAYKNSNSAKLKGFELTLEEFESLSRNPCSYCGEPPIYRRTKYDSDAKGPLYAEDYLNGIDRLNNERGYMLENCVSACPRCNHMKSTLSADEFTNHVTKILNYLTFNNYK